MALVRIFSPDTESELVTIVAMLEAHEIPCFVHNAGFGSLYPGPQINTYNTRAIMIPEEAVPQALELLRDFQAQPSVADPEPGILSKLRAVGEMIFFGWFIPGSRNKEPKK